MYFDQITYVPPVAGEEEDELYNFEFRSAPHPREDESVAKETLPYELAKSFPLVYGPGLLARNAVVWFDEIKRAEDVKAGVVSGKDFEPSLKPPEERRRNFPSTKFASLGYAMPSREGLLRLHEGNLEKLAAIKEKMETQTYDQFSGSLFRHYDTVKNLRKFARTAEKVGTRMKNIENDLFVNRPKQILDAMAADMFRIISNMKFMSNLAENLVETRRWRSSKLRRQANSVRVKAVKAMKISKEIDKSHVMAKQHLVDIEDKTEIELSELNPVLASKLEEFEERFETDVEQTNAMLKKMRSLMVKEYAVLFLDDSRHYRISHKARMMMPNLFHHCRDFFFWTVNMLSWARVQSESFILNFMDQNWEYFYVFYFCLINYAIWKLGRERVPGFVGLYMDAVEYFVLGHWTAELPYLYRIVFTALWRVADQYGILKFFGLIRDAIGNLITSYFVKIPKFWLKQVYWGIRPFVRWVPTEYIVPWLSPVINAVSWLYRQTSDIVAEEFKENISDDFVHANSTRAVMRWITEYDSKNKTNLSVHFPIENSV